MRWSYKTVHFSLKKEGLLGSAFLDESEIESSLNDYGKAGWELVSFTEVSDGLIGVFKQPFSQGISRLEEPDQREEESVEVETEPAQSIDPVITRPAFLFSEKEEEIENMKDKENKESDATGVGSIRIA